MAKVKSKPASASGRLSHHDEARARRWARARGFIAAVSGVIRDCTPPKGLAISGYWGSGKTSALMQVHLRLCGKAPGGGITPAAEPNPGIVPVWFEAWRYQHEALPIVALLNEIREQLGLWEKFKEEAKKVGEVTAGGILYAFEVAIKAASAGLFAPKVEKLRALGTQWEADRYQQALPSASLRRLLEGAIEKALAGSHHNANKLVIFIDDLDRCEPTSALRLLEGIKVFLNLKNCVTVFGMDQRQIERALIEALGLTKGDAGPAAVHAAYQAREYLEKICQDVYHLPLPSKDRKVKFLGDLIAALEVEDTAGMVALKQVLAKYDCLPASPRKIKVLANRIAQWLPRFGSPPHGSQTPPSGPTDFPLPMPERRAAVLLAMCVFDCFHRSIYEQLSLDPGYFNQVMEYAKSTADDEDVSKDPRFRPMAGIQRSRDAQGPIPVNPSDSNVFRLHQLLMDLGTVTSDEVKPYLG